MTVLTDLDNQHKQEIIRILLDSENGVGEEFVKKGGEVFSSGLSAIQSGSIYVIGLNPCGGANYPSIQDHVKNWSLRYFSGFLDQSWHPADWGADCYGLQDHIVCDIRNGQSRHQKTVVKYLTKCFKHSEDDIRNTFATNAVFIASTSADSFKTEHQLSLWEAFERCWPLHQYFLSKIKPTIIFCLGNGETQSAYAFLRKIYGDHRLIELQENRRIFKYFKCSDGLWVIGVRHPSRFSFPKDTTELDDFLARIKF